MWGVKLLAKLLVVLQNIDVLNIALAIRRNKVTPGPRVSNNKSQLFSSGVYLCLLLVKRQCP